MGVREETIRISIFFFLLFTPFSSYMTILTHIYQQDNLPGIGPATLAANYVCFMLSLIVAPALRKTLKIQLLMGGIFYTLNYSSGIFASMTTLSWLKFLISCSGSSIAGLSAGFLWVSQGRYIHLLCEKEGQISRKGEMFGIFSSIYCFSNVSAGLITTFALGFFDPQTYFFIITALGVISILFCLFFVKNISSTKEVILASQSLLEQEENLARQPYSESAYSPWKAIKETVLFVPSMWPVMIILVIDGLSLGVYSSEISHLIPVDTPSDILSKMTGTSTICLGVGATIGGFLSGFFSDKIGELIAGRVGILAWFLSCLIVLLSLLFPSLWLAFTAAFIWGFSLFYVEGWMYIVCSRCYQGKSQAFSVNKLLHCLFYIVSQVIIIATSNQLPLKWIMPSISLLAIPSFFIISKLQYTDKKD